MKRTLILALGALGVVFSLGFGFSGNLDCSGNPNRNTQICNGMRNLRTMVMLLSEQRDLMQFDYKFLQSTAKNMQHVVTNLLRQPSDYHMDNLNLVLNKTIELDTLAENNDPLAFQVANQVHQQCKSCHTEQNAWPGYNWGDIFRSDWNSISKYCNDPNSSRIPYRCKNMYAMLNIVEYFMTTVPVGNYHFEGISGAARELLRISNDLNEKHLLHSCQGEQIFENLKVKSQAIIDYAHNQDIDNMVSSMSNIYSTCMNCHQGGTRNPCLEEEDHLLKVPSNFAPDSQK